jgi:RNA polymerase sigma-70 factor (ECF subfamily)
MKLSENELNQLVKGCIAGARKDQQQLFKCFFGKMMVVCMRYTKDRDTAQDILQDGFIKAFEKMPDFTFTGSFEGWLRRIMVNTAIDHFRKSKHIVELLDNKQYDSEDDDGDQSDFEDKDESSDDNWGNLSPEKVLEAMQSLSPAYRTVFNLYVMENYSHKDIAELLNINIGTSKSNLAKARINLKKILEKNRMINSK